MHVKDLPAPLDLHVRSYVVFYVAYVDCRLSVLSGRRPDAAAVTVHVFFDICGHCAVAENSFNLSLVPFSYSSTLTLASGPVVPLAPLLVLEKLCRLRRSMKEVLFMEH